MDPNLPKRLSNVVRKRRSSILKSQRPPRTPFSELEFNVATPGDTKSRRVSFSRHKDVAEFIKHEATTTWRSIYVEHNKSDSLGNDSDIQQKPTTTTQTQNVRTFDQQFENIETDCIETLELKSRTPFNDLNSTGRLTLEQSLVDSRINTPGHNFEISFLTDVRSGILDTEAVIPETSGGINIDFSSIQSIGSGKDDLDAITDDIRQSDELGGRFRNRNISQYIEVDFDMTRRPNENSDMSITDTITSPKVQTVAPVFEERKAVAKDWMTDKENMVLNPYIEPHEEDNFALNNEPEKVLVFTGKNLKYANIDADLDDLEDPIVKPNKGSMANLLDLEVPFADLPSTSKDYYGGPSSSRSIVTDVKSNPSEMRVEEVQSTSKNIVQEIIGNISLIRHTDGGNLSGVNRSFDDDIPKSPRKTIVLNIDDDLPNFVSETQVGLRKGALHSTLSKISVADLESRRSLFDKELEVSDGGGNVSKTQVLPISEVRCQISDDVSRGFPVKIHDPEIRQERKTIIYDDDEGGLSLTQALSTNINACQEKRRTIVYDNDTGDLSMTQALPSKIVPNEKRRTIVYDNDEGDLSMTQAIPSKIIPNEKRRTIVYDNDTGDLSMTQALPSKIVPNEKRRTIVYDNDEDDLSLTQALPSKIVPNEKRRTIVYDNDTGDLSMTQALPSKIVPNEKRRTIVYDNDEGDLSLTQALPSKIVPNEKRRTIVYDNDTGDLSMTQALPSKIVPNEKRRTIVYDNDTGDLSMTQALPSKIVPNEKRRTIVYDNDEGDLSLTQALPSKIVPNEKRRTIVYDNDTGDLSMTQALPSKIVPNEKRRTIVYDNDEGDLSLTQALPSKIVPNEKRRTIVYDNDTGDLSMTQALPSKIVPNEKRRTIVYDNDEGDLSLTQALPSKIVPNEKRRTIVYDNDTGDLSITQALPSKIVPNEKRRAIVYGNNADDLSMTKALPSKIISQEKRQTVIYDDCMDDLSITQPLPMDVDVKHEKRRTIVLDLNKENLSTTQVFLSRVDTVKEKNITIVYDENGDEPAKIDEEPKKITVVEENKEDVIEESILTGIDTAKENMKTVDVSNLDKTQIKPEVSMNRDKLKVIHFNDEIDKSSAHSLPIIQTRLVAENNLKSQSQGHLFSKIESLAVNDDKRDISEMIQVRNVVEAKTNSLDAKEAKAAEDATMNQVHKTQDEVVVYQSITTASNKTITQSIRKVNEANTSIINRLEGDLKECPETVLGKSTNFISTNKNVEVSERISVKESSVSNRDSRVDNPIHVIFSVKKDEDIMSSSEQDVSVCVAHVSPNFDDEMATSDKSVQIHEESAFLIEDEDSMVEKSVQINTNSRKSMINEILNMPAPMEIDFQTEVTNGTQTVDCKESSDSIIRIIDDGMKENGVDANQEEELVVMNKECKIGRLSQNVMFHKDKNKTNETAESKVEKNHLVITDNNTEYLIDALSDYIDTKYVEKHLNNREEKMKALTSCQSPVVNKEELMNISTADMEVDVVEETPIPVQPYKTATRVSNDIVKVLKFDDSVTEKEEDLSPLRKSTHLESQKDVTKGCVIPPYLDEVSDELKEIMGELVKPMVDVPLETKIDDYKDTNRKSAKIQANLQTSSQIDIVIETIKSPISKPKPNRKTVVPDNKILTFDVRNPLNNISIPKLINTEVHKYNPITKDDNIKVANKKTGELRMVEDENYVQIVQEARVMTNNEDKVRDRRVVAAVSTQVSEEGLVEVADSKKEPNVKEIDVNTIIAMKSNSELLAEGSSLTIAEKATAKDVNRKRNYSPVKALRKERTPKPLKKILRKSQSPIKNRQAKREDDGTVKKLITECYASVDNIKDLDILKKESTKSVDVGVSLESLNSERGRESLNVEIKPEVPTLKSELYCYNSGKVEDSRFDDDSKPEKISLKDDDFVPEVNRLEDVLNGLPFMGTKLCYLETNSGSDEWSFLLLHSRLKLDVKFVPDDSVGYFIKPDRRIEKVSVDVVRSDKHTIASQTTLITYASILNYLKRHNMLSAEEVPELIQRVTTICWQARRWGQVMEATRTRLAYKVTDDGVVSLKVANVSLRSIWEVTLKINNTSLPLASDVRVINCLTQYNVSQADVDKLVCKIPKDWGHVPNTLWKLFKYLKNKNTSDCIVLGL